MIKILQKIFPEKAEFIEEFDDFTTYLTGFHTNRENYYTTKDEKSTAVATRIVHENLPKFCQNIFTFLKKKDDYLAAYGKISHKTLQIKDSRTGEMKKISPITEDIFEISFFNYCLNQIGIDDYNRIICEYNELINLYNQGQKDKSARLSLFKILYKQIGAKNSETFQMLSFQNDDEFIAHIKEKFIPESITKNAEIEKIFKNFSEKTDEDFEKIYLSKAAINTISNKIFANWFLLSEILIKEKIWNHDAEGNVKIPEATSLATIFQAMNHFSREEIFKENLLEKWKDFDRKNSEIFIKILISDVENIISENRKFSENLEKILQKFQKNNSEHKAILKDFADSSRIPASMLKYFLVKKLDLLPNDVDFYSQISNILADFGIFHSYDAVRNYITKAEIPDEKMKLNFENGTLAAGWDINKERDNYCVILENEK